MRMRKVMAMLWLLVFCIGVSACGGPSKEQKAAREIPLKWAQASVQEDEKTLSQLAVSQKHIDPNQEAKNDKKIEKYGLVEWKIDDKAYYYEITYEDPRDGKTQVTQMKVIRTEKGWKNEAYGNPKDFEAKTSTLKKVIVKGLE